MLSDYAIATSFRGQCSVTITPDASIGGFLDSYISDSKKMLVSIEDSLDTARNTAATKHIIPFFIKPPGGLPASLRYEGAASIEYGLQVRIHRTKGSIRVNLPKTAGVPITILVPSVKAPLSENSMGGIFQSGRLTLQVSKSVNMQSKAKETCRISHPSSVKLTAIDMVLVSELVCRIYEKKQIHTQLYDMQPVIHRGPKFTTVEFQIPETAGPSFSISRLARRSRIEITATSDRGWKRTFEVPIIVVGPRATGKPVPEPYTVTIGQTSAFQSPRASPSPPASASQTFSPVNVVLPPPLPTKSPRRISESTSRPMVVASKSAPRASISGPRPSFVQSRPSINLSRPSLNLPRPNFDNPKVHLSLFAKSNKSERPAHKPMSSPRTPVSTKSRRSSSDSSPSLSTVPALDYSSGSESSSRSRSSSSASSASSFGLVTPSVTPGLQRRVSVKKFAESIGRKLTFRKSERKPLVAPAEVNIHEAETESYLPSIKRSNTVKKTSGISIAGKLISDPMEFSCCGGPFELEPALYRAQVNRF